MSPNQQSEVSNSFNFPEARPTPQSIEITGLAQPEISPSPVDFEDLSSTNNTSPLDSVSHEAKDRSPDTQTVSLESLTPEQAVSLFSGLTARLLMVREQAKRQPSIKR